MPSWTQNASKLSVSLYFRARTQTRTRTRTSGLTCDRASQRENKIDNPVLKRRAHPIVNKQYVTGSTLPQTHTHTQTLTHTHTHTRSASIVYICLYFLFCLSHSVWPVTSTQCGWSTDMSESRHSEILGQRIW